MDCRKCVFEEDNVNTEPCKSCIADKQKASLFKRDKKIKAKNESMKILVSLLISTIIYFVFVK